MPTNPGYNPTRRNRNIGTAKQGYGQNNKMTIPWPAVTMKSFYERLGDYRKSVREIGGKSYTFVVETPREHCFHTCSIADVTRMLDHVPPDDLVDLDLIVFRQPKRKEEILSPVWGRLIYSYEFENHTKSAIILESVDSENRLKWPRHLSVDGQKEFARLTEDGHVFREKGRYFEADFDPVPTRNTQLYRTLLHEIGHYVQFLTSEKYWAISVDETERFAHRHANSLRQTLFESGIIPFEPLADE